MNIAPAELESIIREELETVLREVSSEKQRRWACAQKDKSADDRPESLSAEEAEEMCKSKVEGKMMSDRPVGNPSFPAGHPFSTK